MSKKAPEYTPDVMPLRWPIKDDKGAEIKELTLSLISHGDHADVLSDDPDDRDAFAEFARLSCGLTLEEVKRLKAPDWNTLRLKLSDLVTKPSAHFFKALGVKIDPYRPQLLAPVQRDDGSTATHVALEVPSVATTDLMQKQPDAMARTMFITMSCTGFSKAELDRLSAPDWTQLQERLNDFLNESAAYFQ